MEATYVTDAIVLKRDPFREADSRVVLYSRDHGLLELVARGARKPGSKLAGHLEPFTAVSAMVVPGRQWSYVGAAVDRRSHRRLKAGLDTVRAAGGAVRAFLYEVRGGIADESLFHLLTGLLDRLDAPALHPADSELAAAAFLLKLLSALGYRPQLGQCLECGAPLANAPSWFDPARGGSLCGTHGAGKGFLTVNRESGSVLQTLLHDDWPAIAALTCDSAILVQTIEIIRSFHRYHSLNQH